MKLTTPPGDHRCHCRQWRPDRGGRGAGQVPAQRFAHSRNARGPRRCAAVREEPAAASTHRSLPGAWRWKAARCLPPTNRLGAGQALYRRKIRRGAGRRHAILHGWRHFRHDCGVSARLSRNPYRTIIRVCGRAFAGNSTATRLMLPSARWMWPRFRRIWHFPPLA
jgi:hypothetical protein